MIQINIKKYSRLYYKYSSFIIAVERLLSFCVACTFFISHWLALEDALISYSLYIGTGSRTTREYQQARKFKLRYIAGLYCST